MTRTPKERLGRGPLASLSLLSAAAIIISSGCSTTSQLGIEAADGDYWRGYTKDLKYLVTSPARWDKKDWGIVGGVMAGTLLLYAYDENIREAAQASVTDESSDLADISEKLSRYQNHFPGLLALYGLGACFDDPKLKEVALLGSESLLMAMGLVMGGKHLIGRARPFLEEGKADFLGPSYVEDYNSWPSGHTTVVFALATAFHKEYKNPWVTTIAYTIAGLGGWSRIHDDWHWASDVLAGAALGTAIGHGVYNARKARQEEGSAYSGGRLIAMPNGVGVEWQF